MTPPMCFVRCDLSHTGAAGKVVAGVRPWPDSESQTSRGRFGLWTRPDRRVSNTERWPTFNPERWDERDELCLGSGCSER